jgi:hypothetical protein
MQSYIDYQAGKLENYEYPEEEIAMALAGLPQPLEVSGKATQFGGTWIFSKKIGSVRPFALGGAGFIVTVPGSSPYSVTTVMRPDFIYGGGVDWSFLPHLGLRLQVRGNMSKAPNLSDLFNSTTKYTQVYEPMGGVFYRF